MVTHQEFIDHLLILFAREVEVVFLVASGTIPKTLLTILIRLGKSNSAIPIVFVERLPHLLLQLLGRLHELMTEHLKFDTQL